MLNLNSERLQPLFCKSIISPQVYEGSYNLLCSYYMSYTLFWLHTSSNIIFDTLRLCVTMPGYKICYVLLYKLGAFWFEIEFVFCHLISIKNVFLNSKLGNGCADYDVMTKLSICYLLKYLLHCLKWIYVAGHLSSTLFIIVKTYYKNGIVSHFYNYRLWKCY